jgi:hypothetical protein
VAAVLSHSRMPFFDSVVEPGWKVFRRKYGRVQPTWWALDSRGSAAIGDR